MAPSAAEPPTTTPGGGEGSASTRYRSTPFAEFVCPSGVPTVRVNREEDWESEGSNAWIPSGSFRIFAQQGGKICSTNFGDDLGILFALNASCRFGKIRIHVDRGRASSLVWGIIRWSGIMSLSAAASSKVCRPLVGPQQPICPNASGSQIVRTVDVEDDADIEDQSPQDDEDELMFPELVDRCSKQAMEDQYMEDIAFGARFDDNDDEEKNENDDSLVLADYEGEDLPTIEWNGEDPQLVEGTVFQTMMDCRNAITTYHILTKNNFELVKSEPDQAGAENAKENEATIQLEIEAAFNMRRLKQQMREEIEASVQHEEIEACRGD
ncbi:hypothetical protein QYE76_042141 [Lolium multiflorum]|uniref:Uncharacterized protein n=1 Tax=Lolium multiflorum TaxID=4521 RepID=A0AAD8TGN0_LOLMU|nr:hypothetical protein QYE76_042141 [Lolium multiflorum]